MLPASPAELPSYRSVKVHKVLSANLTKAALL